MPTPRLVSHVKPCEARADGPSPAETSDHDADDVEYCQASAAKTKAPVDPPKRKRPPIAPSPVRPLPARAVGQFAGRDSGVLDTHVAPFHSQRSASLTPVPDPPKRVTESDPGVLNS